MGSSKNSTTLVSLKIGKQNVLVDLGLLVDELRTTTDGTKKARSALKPLALNSSVLPGVANLLGVLPEFVAESPGGQEKVEGSALNLANPGGALSGLPAALPLNLLSGDVVPAVLGATTKAGANSTLVSQLLNVGFLKNALQIKAVNNDSATAAEVKESNGARTLKVGAITLLNLGDLLRDLGINLKDLPIGMISELVQTLKVTGIDLPTGQTSVAGAVASLDAAIAGIKNQVRQAPAVGTQVVNTVETVKSTIVGLGVAIPVDQDKPLVSTVELLDDTVNEALVTVQKTLEELLDKVLELLGKLSLLEIGGAEVSVNTLATDSVSTSRADVVAKILPIKVLGIELPGVDLVTIGNTLNSVTGILDGALGVLGLSKLVEVKLLEKDTSVTSANGYVTSKAAFNLLRVSINPPSNLTGIVSGLLGGGSTASTSPLSLLQGAGMASAASGLPTFGGALAPLAGNLNLPSALAALLEGLSLRIGAVEGLSDHKLAAASVPAPAISNPSAAAPAQAPGGTLPRTGNESTQLMVLAAAMAAAAFGLRRYVLRPARTNS